jgi:hypothetical protein
MDEAPPTLASDEEIRGDIEKMSPEERLLYTACVVAGLEQKAIRFAIVLQELLREAQVTQLAAFEKTLKSFEARLQTPADLAAAVKKALDL